MKPQLFFVCLLLVLFFSCKKENAKKPSGGDSETRLTKMVVVSGGVTTTVSTTTTTTLQYDANGKLTNWRRIDDGSAPLDEGLRIQRKADGMIDKIIFKRSPFPDSVTLLVASSGTKYANAQWTQSNFGGAEVRRMTFVYDNAGNITEATSADVFNGQPDPKEKHHFTYSNGNIISFKSYNISGGTNDLIIQHDREYDQKPNPLAFGPEWIVLTFTGMFFGPDGSANNFIRHAIKRPGRPEIPITAAYTHNDKNMPLTAVQKNAAGQVVATTTYAYE